MRRLQIELLGMLLPGLIMTFVGLLIGGMMLRPEAIGPWLKAALPMRVVIAALLGGIVLSNGIMKYYRIVRDRGIGNQYSLAMCVATFGLIMPVGLALGLLKGGLLEVGSYYTMGGLFFSCIFGMPLLRTMVYELIAL